MTIEEICEKYDIKNYTINNDGSIDVDGNVSLFNIGLIEIPLKFNRIYGHFSCSKNKLTSLKGSPRWVDGSFYCYYNQLSSLEFSPEYVGDDFDCSYNDLTNLDHSPKEVGKSYFCFNNKQLKDIKGISEKLNGFFYCEYTPLSSIFDKVDKHFLHAFNFYKIIKDDTVNLKRLKYVMDLYDKPIRLKQIEKYYTII